MSNRPVFLKKQAIDASPKIILRYNEALIRLKIEKKPSNF